jgi:hypothetical protein
MPHGQPFRFRRQQPKTLGPPSINGEPYDRARVHRPFRHRQPACAGHHPGGCADQEHHRLARHLRHLGHQAVGTRHAGFDRAAAQAAGPPAAQSAGKLPDGRRRGHHRHAGGGIGSLAGPALATVVAAQAAGLQAGAGGGPPAAAFGGATAADGGPGLEARDLQPCVAGHGAGRCVDAVPRMQRDGTAHGHAGWPAARPGRDVHRPSFRRSRCRPVAGLPELPAARRAPARRPAADFPAHRLPQGAGPRRGRTPRAPGRLGLPARTQARSGLTAGLHAGRDRRRAGGVAFAQRRHGACQCVPCASCRANST